MYAGVLAIGLKIRCFLHLLQLLDDLEGCVCLVRVNEIVALILSLCCKRVLLSNQVYKSTLLRLQSL